MAPAELGGELRASLFNRMTSLFASAVVLFAVAVAVAVHHPQAPYIAWAVLDAVTSLARVLSAVAILRHRRRYPGEAAPDNLAPDIYVVSCLLWCAVLGCGSGLCLSSGDLGVSVVGCLIATATLGAQCGRVPGTPRLLVLQLVAIDLPLSVGGWCAPDTFLHWIVIVAPAYLFAIVSINRQLHRDYVEMLVGRQESRLMALRCPLTGLANRRAFDRALASALAGPSRIRPTVVLSLDLDGFKSVNDDRGHLAGDLLLRQVAERLLSQVPAGNLTARLGGDEFAVISCATAAGAAEQIACRILAALREPFSVSGHPVSIGVSIGLARASTFCTPDRLLGEADEALYTAKRSGRNRYCWFGAQAVLPDNSAMDPQVADFGRGGRAMWPPASKAAPPLVLSGGVARG